MSVFGGKKKGKKNDEDGMSSASSSRANTEVLSHSRDNNNNSHHLSANIVDYPHSPNHPTIQKAMDGKMNNRDEFMACLDLVRKDNGQSSDKTGVQLSKGTLEFPLADVVDFDDTSQRGWVQDTVQITYTGSKSKVYLLTEAMPNPKFDLIIPGLTEIKQGKTIDLTFKLRAFCTTKLYLLVKIQIFKHKPGNNSSRGESDKEELGHFYLSSKVESSLSHIIDYDEIKMGGALGKGGYGTVYEATWRETEVAVKVLNVEDIFTDAELDAVKREIRLMSKLAHQHVVTYMGSTQVRGQPLTIVMELVKGGSVTQLLASRQLTDHFRAKLCLDVAKGMQYLHNRNIYHRDIKPDNMLVVSPSEDAWVNIKITDFGTGKTSVRTQSSDYDTLDRKDIKVNAAVPKKVHGPDSGPGVGTLIYSAPEVFGTSDYPIGKTDVFSFGMSTWQIFTGKEPYSDPPYNNWSRFALRKFVIDGERLEIPATIHPAVTQLIKRCWAHDPSMRPDFNTIVGELEAIIPVLQQHSHQKEMAKGNMPIPRGNLNLIGWNGDISREFAEEKLANKPPGTFLVRYSKNTKSYVLSYVQKDQRTGPYQHIGFIKPLPDGRVSVDREDKTQQYYDNIFDYVEAMKKSGIIKDPLLLSEPENTYAPTPAVYQRSPSLEGQSMLPRTGSNNSVSSVGSPIGRTSSGNVGSPVSRTVSGGNVSGRR